MRTMKTSSTEHVCARCSKAKKDCCHLRGEGLYKFGMTDSDVRRLVKLTGKKPSEFADLEDVPKYIKQEIEANFPGMGRMFPYNKRISLKFDGPDNACTFLGPRGCTLPFGQKPRTCAIYPAWYQKQEDSYNIQLHALADEQRCMAVAEGGKHVLKVLNQDSATLGRMCMKSDQELEAYSKLTAEEIEELYER